MPPRIPMLSAVGPARTFVKSQICQFSKTATSQALRDVGTSRPPASSASTLLDLDASPARAPRNKTAMAQAIFNRLRSPQRRTPEGEELKVETELRGKNLADDYMRQAPRRWNLGDVYAPHDLSAVEMKKWRKITTVERDLVDLLGLSPLDMYRNFSFISEYTTPHGRIKRADQTGLRPVNQRKVAKAIRRSIGLGLHPSVHRHPELLKRERRQVGQQNAPTGRIGNHYAI
ncbi:hypothetical protein BKA67DRAFT_560563 [Truncatella angustata]|uniref:Small ribosomal subunit protein bS18m n=1 Tax=Truncatella angustata TaxID=152316 RepID=A0A9P8UNE5_9PEZI|nr:uncharacterized protein BKA67DRAFT_560563 [Truncatella angustata]KAH6655397.1 hypothetical protein BKA67DRAFT_560563 [Truncatella angustata]KAH8199502.1 hypothetical protein TruAng_006315 [Truncatella angustata]